MSEKLPLTGKQIAKTLTGFIAILCVYPGMPLLMIHEKQVQFEKNEQYIKDHHCHLVSTQPAFHVGPMIDGGWDTYKCPDGSEIELR